MFAINRAVGPGRVFDEVQVLEMSASDIPQGTPTEVPQRHKGQCRQSQYQSCSFPIRG